MATAPADLRDAGPLRTTPARRNVDVLTRLVDAASIVAFRVGYGLLAAFSMLRVLWKGWVDTLYVDPAYHLTYPRFEWVRPLPSPWMHLSVVVLAALGLTVAAGWHTRACAAMFTLGFTYVELIDAALYLNHYWYMSLAALLLAVLPPARLVDRVPLFVVWALRAQIAVVYLFAGLAKINGDWLLHGLPMRLWLADRTSFPVLGPALAEPAVAVAASWAGMVFDLTIVGWLSWRRTRPYAYAAVVAFHALTAALFRIGVFPWVMIASTLIFFDPAWPRRLVGARGARAERSDDPVRTPSRRRSTLAFLGLLAVVELALPLRHLVYPGDVRWTEEGYYLSWRVMLTEKAGFLELDVRDASSGASWRVGPDLVLAPWQVTQAATRPDLVVATAHLIAAHYLETEHRRVEVRAISFVAMNGGAARRLVDETIDLARVPRTETVRHVLATP